MPDTRRQALGENAETAADLEHDIVAIEPGEALDHVEQVAVDEEILTEVARAAGAHQPKTAAALRSRSPSSSS